MSLKTGLQFAVDDCVDDNLADLEVILHSGGEDISGLTLSSEAMGIDEVRIPQALRGSTVHERIGVDGVFG